MNLFMWLSTYKKKKKKEHTFGEENGIKTLYAD